MRNPPRWRRERDHAANRRDVRLGGRTARNAEPVDPAIRTTHNVPSHHRMRACDRDPIRGGHYGQRSCEPREQAEHMAATDQLHREENPCQLGAVHTWHNSEVRAAQESGRLLGRSGRRYADECSGGFVHCLLDRLHPEGVPGGGVSRSAPCGVPALAAGAGWRIIEAAAYGRAAATRSRTWEAASPTSPASSRVAGLPLAVFVRTCSL